jgi:hypothetical protein
VIDAVEAACTASPWYFVASSRTARHNKPIPTMWHRLNVSGFAAVITESLPEREDGLRQVQQTCPAKPVSVSDPS